jgi:uncharacterized membrane protein YoaK (UPF0700 family)
VSDETHITRITKRGWDRLLLPIAIASTVCATLLGAVTGFWDALTLPAFTSAAWLYFRCTTPATGMKAVSISGNPKVKALLAWLGFILAVTALWALVDTQFLGNSIYAPLTVSQIIGFVTLIALLLAGVFVIERRYPPVPKQPPDGG